MLQTNTEVNEYIIIIKEIEYKYKIFLKICYRDDDFVERSRKSTRELLLPLSSCVKSSPSPRFNLICNY